MCEAGQPGGAVGGCRGSQKGRRGTVDNRDGPPAVETNCWCGSSPAAGDTGHTSTHIQRFLIVALGILLSAVFLSLTGASVTAQELQNSQEVGASMDDTQVTQSDSFDEDVYAGIERQPLTGASAAQSEAFFFVSDLSPQTATVERGVTIEVSATVENLGDLNDTQTIQLDIDGITDSQSLTLAGGDSETVSFTVDTSDVSAGDYTHSVSSDDDSVAGALTVEEPPSPASL